jgi:hypothetical protein
MNTKGSHKRLCDALCSAGSRSVVGMMSALVLGFTTANLQAFSLLGPYQDWMTPALAYRQAGDIGGPMVIGQGYRWNVPVVTYAFDQSFLDYFGSNGVAAVEQAIQTLNELPPASDITVTDYSLDPVQVNYAAQSEYLYDLKSATLSILLEQMGLTSPARYMFTLLRWDPALWPPPWAAWNVLDFIPDPVAQRDYDPLSLVPSVAINGELYEAYINIYGNDPSVPPVFVEIVTQPADPGALPSTAVADWPALWTAREGLLFTGLSQDDVGGLRYLLSKTNIALEMLLPDVQAADTNATAYVNLGLRGGVEKITFVRQDYDPLLQKAFPLTYQYSDVYFTNGLATTQQLQRVVSQPDFLFCSADTGGGNVSDPDYLRTGTSNWWSSASVNGGTNAGPGVIRPPVRITFNRFGLFAFTMDPNPPANATQAMLGWGSFGNTTNAPLVYPVGAGPVIAPMTLRLRLSPSSTIPSSPSPQTFEWQLPSCGAAALQTSSNLLNWTTCLVVTNRGATVEWQHTGLSNSQEFFRAVPQ